MNVKNIIDEMGARAFAYSFLQGINDLYDAKERSYPPEAKVQCFETP